MKLNNTLNQRLNTLLEQYKQIQELDLGQRTNNMYLLAKRFIDTGAIPNLNDLNMFLNPFNITLTQNQLDYLLNISPVSAPFTSDVTSNLEMIKNLVGVKQNKKSIVLTPGVYVFRNTKNKDMYVGSSIVLNNRLPVYFNHYTLVNDSRKIVKSFSSDGYDSFVMDLYLINEYKDRESAIVLSRALEQYLIFTLKPLLNTSLVAARKVTGPWNEDKLKPLYVYNADKTKLLSVTNRRVLGISTNILTDYLKSGRPSRGGFIFIFPLGEQRIISAC